MKLPPLHKLGVVLYPDPVLKKKCAPITEFDDSLSKLVERMFILMREGEGVGLAAPQVGIPVRLFVCNPTGEEPDNLVCVNPEFVELTGSEERSEGCLSIPDVHVMMRRAAKAVMTAQDLRGVRFTVTADGLAARVWQHEIDHLNGRLIIDAMSATDELANRKQLKQLRDGESRH